MIVVAGPPGSGKRTFFPIGAQGVDAFSIDDRCAQIVESYRAIPPVLAYAGDLRDLTALLQEAEVIAPAQVPLPARTAGDSSPAQTHLVAPLFEQAMSDLRQRDPERFFARVRELGYLVNVWIAGGAHEGRRPRPVEALETVLKTCEAGMRTQLGAGRAKPDEALAVLVRAPADALFRWGFRAAG